VWIQRTDVVEVLRVPSLIGSGFVFRTVRGDADDVIVWCGSAFQSLLRLFGCSAVRLFGSRMR